MNNVEKNHLNYSGKILARSARGIVISLDDDRVAKLSYINSYEQMESESRKMAFANKINDLVVKFIELKKDEDDNNLLIMERLYPLEYRALDIETRYSYCEAFELKLTELHNAGFVFRDLFATVIKGYTNYILTKTGIRLIDTGISLLKEDIGPAKFQAFVNEETVLIKNIKRIILSNEIPFSELT